MIPLRLRSARDGGADEFDRDPFPGRPRILFVGWPESSHTHSWIDLLADAPFNVQLFALPSSAPPAEWPVRSYLTAPGLARRADAWRRTIFPPPPGSPQYAVYQVKEACNRGLFASGPTARLVTGAARASEWLFEQRHPSTIEAALSQVVRRWRPDVVHTLGFDPASYLYLRTRRTFDIGGIGRWVAQARGGPDIALHRYLPEFLPRMLDVWQECDHFIADNQQNYDYALGAGLHRDKVENPGMGVVSGPGGIDTVAVRQRWHLPPSRRERTVVWPKAYETNTAKALPVFAAIVQAWERIQPCRIEMLWMVQPEVRIWYEKLLPDAIKANCPTFGRLSREETLERMARARVMMAPSLSDGIPNTMIEAMALGAAPLVSPLETITPVVDSDHVVFARNLYPDEIAGALVRLMTEDALVDRLAENNLVRVRELADRDRVRRRALAYYEHVARLNAAGGR
jgi:glycosyltransferase involved in cell wall biosynthesis